MRDVQQMSDRELDVALARVLYGWTIAPAVPPYTRDRNACAEMEAELEKRQTRGKYIMALLALVDPRFHGDVALHYTTMDVETCWLLATATPRQRCEAAYLALQRDNLTEA